MAGTRPPRPARPVAPLQVYPQHRVARVVCTPVPGTQDHYTNQSTCSVVNAPTTGGGTANTATSCALVAGTASTVTGLSGLHGSGHADRPWRQSHMYSGGRQPDHDHRGACTTVNAPTTSGSTAVTKVDCTLLSIPNVNITSGSCPASTATQTISCSALQKIASLQLTNQTECKNAAGVSGTAVAATDTELTGSSVGQVTCSATYTLRNSGPNYWVASATTPTKSTTSTPVYDHKWTLQSSDSPWTFYSPQQRPKVRHCSIGQLVLFPPLLAFRFERHTLPVAQVARILSVLYHGSSHSGG